MSNQSKHDALLAEIDELDARGYECQRRGDSTGAQLAWGNMNALALDLDEAADTTDPRSLYIVEADDPAQQ